MIPIEDGRTEPAFARSRRLARGITALLPGAGKWRKPGWSGRRQSRRSLIVASRGRADWIGRVLRVFEGAATSPPGSLGLVHGNVGADQQALQVTAVRGLRDAGTDSEGDRRPRSEERRVG